MTTVVVATSPAPAAPAAPVAVAPARPAIVVTFPGGKRVVRDMVLDSLADADIELLDTRVPQRTALEQAEYIAQPVSFLDPKGKEAKVFRHLATEILQRINKEAAVAV